MNFAVNKGTSSMENSDLPKSLDRFEFDLFLAWVELSLNIFYGTSAFDKMKETFYSKSRMQLASPDG